MTSAPVSTPPGRRHRRRGPRGEDTYRARIVRGATFYTSREEHQDLTIVVKRFPSRHDPRDGDRVFVLVHGIGVSSRYYQPLAAELALRGPVFLVDLPGYGAAPDPRRDVSIADHAAVLASFLERAGFDNPILVGHSWGTQVVSTLAADHPHVTDRIVLMAPTIEPEARTAAAAIGRLFRDAFREPPVVFGIAFTDYVLRCGLPYLLRQLRHLLADRMEERLPQLDARVLVVNGDRDPIVTDVWASGLSDLGGSFEFVEVRGPHVIMHTDPVQIARAITEFLDRHGRDR